MSDGAAAGRRPPVTRVDRLIGYGDPDRPAVTYKSETLTYRQLADQVARVANGLHGLGVRRGDRVAVYAPKQLETVVALLAVSAAGGIFVPVNPLFKARHLAHVAADCGARVMITTAERLDTVRAALPASVEHVVLIGPAAPATTAWDQLARSTPDPVPDGEAVIDADLAAILYTSGSTGGPKGVMLSHRNLIAGAESVAGYLGHTADDTVLAALPLSFDAGLSQLTISLIAGAHVVLANYLLPRDIVRLCAQHGITGLTCVPPLWIQLAGQEWPQEAAGRLRYFANTGGRMPASTLARLRELLPNAKPYLMYGLTEAFRSTYLDPAEADRRPDSIGKAIPNAEILVVRPDGTPCDPGEHGELVHRGALVAQGYWNDPERTAERFRPLPGAVGPAARPELAVWSGDAVYRDADGFLYFVGRADEMIKTSGYRVSPAEIEEAAYASGQAAEAVALGVGDERLGQHIVLVVSEPCDTGLLKKSLAQELPTYMQPQRVVVLPELPRSVNGKFDRVELRRMVAQ
ncbi:MAG TPA: acyl-CoA ligase (AMP-forming), exosortase A system-associated [Actinocrinis sp.]|nr:acyl-CoA ligase (AMP-forming), exosortase A system-associated [Actinocrinis sp.]HEV3169860.1 acyl-CoA ligase (AMP-forming), exosortase A system-associated [Actinocrinis sp.]